MRYEMNFGSVNQTVSPPANPGVFRIAVLGDLSGRANSGRLETGSQLAERKPHRVDVENLDDVIERFGIRLHLPIADNGGTVELNLSCMDDFHPDELFESLDVFSKLAGLRAKLLDSNQFPAASKAVLSLLGRSAVERHTERITKPRGAAIPNAKMSDFARLVGRPTADAETPVVELLKQLVAPHVTSAKDPQQDQMVAAIDEALSDSMRRVLHHPDFQSLESIWRSVELLVRRLDSGGVNLQIVLYDVTAEEVAADLSSTDQLEETGLFKLLVEQPALDAQQGALSLFLGNYTFEQTPPHADLLGRLAKIAAASKAPFVGAISNECLKKQSPDEIHPLVRQSWDEVRGLSEAEYLALTVPRFMLRWPYGKKTDPIDAFELEEFTRQLGVRGMLWGNSAFLVGLLLGETYQQQGLKAMKLGSVLTVGEMPYYYYIDDHGDQIALPCTDRLLSERLSAHVSSQNLLPVLSIKGRPEVRLAGFRSLAGKPLAGPWQASGDTPPSDGPKPISAPAGVAAGTAGEARPPAATAEAPTQPAASAADNELDALLAGLDDNTTPTQEQAAPVENKADDELDSLLADLDAGKGEEAKPASPPEQATAADDELDALLAGLDSGTSQPPAGENDMDPELAALLGDL